MTPAEANTEWLAGYREWEAGLLVSAYCRWLDTLPVIDSEASLERHIYRAVASAVPLYGGIPADIDAITAAVMKVVRPYVEALERIAPDEAQAIETSKGVNT